MALYSKNILLSLFGGVFLGLFILNDFSLFATFGAIYTLFINLLSEGWILKTVVFAILVGSVMELLQKSGSIDGFVSYMSHKTSLVNSGRSALLLSYIIGVVIFIESSITSLIAGAVGRPLCDKYGVAHAKLAFVCDSTSAPISSLIVLNGWGALLLGLISTQIQEGTMQGDSIDILLNAVLYNFYAMSALVVTFIAIWFNIDIGAMKRAKSPQKIVQFLENSTISPLYMLLPIGVMIVSLFLFLYLTGNGNILKGSGSSSIFYTMLFTLFFIYILYIPKKLLYNKTYAIAAFSGAKKLFPIALILLFAFAIGKVTNDLKTGEYLATLASANISVYMLGGLIFVLSAIISFATGTSWGTFSIMIPIAAPLAMSMDANITLAIGAVISGGVFGDHCSPISDTTIISSLASDCEVVEHVQTQLPYALISGVIAFILFIVMSII
ncbi:Na+/H+ antiporter NhaC family protein [Sulfurimonas sp.]|uniref:Na+/H+ antiporter NhaC family protein n=1 Tax=Sulfurimonas sp. TaxID=2022749 RepID=UPI0026343677|nr:Na+/H+ antiporter NhaC family protein [Sulfurimonas sp.]